MKHPDELMLTGYVDRSLPEDERRAIADHLRSCELCRDDVELAAAGRQVLASLPVAEAPPIGWPSGAETGRRVAASRSGPPRWHRALAGVAAAAAVVVAVAVVGPNLGSSSRDAAAPALGAQGTPGAPEASGGPPAPTSADGGFVVHQPIDYDGAGLQQLARDQASASSEARGVFAADASTKAKPGTLTCLGSSGAQDEKLRGIIAARFEGTPAWIGVYVHRSTAGSVDRIVVRALEKPGCRLLATAEAAG